MLRPKLALLLTNVLKKHDIFYTSVIPEVTLYEPLYNKNKSMKVPNAKSCACVRFSSHLTNSHQRYNSLQVTILLTCI